MLTGKEARKLWGDGESVEYYRKDRDEWFEVRGNTFVSIFDSSHQFRLKPRTITINGIEVPAPFEPKEGEKFWHLYPPMDRGYNYTTSRSCDHYEQFGAWRTEEEIKQVVSALRSIFR